MDVMSVDLGFIATLTVLKKYVMGLGALICYNRNETPILGDLVLQIPPVYGSKSHDGFNEISLAYFNIVDI
jgi:hypothetical protein